VALPRTVRVDILLRTLTQTILLEIANRQAGVQSAEIPLWLVEGMVAHLQAGSLQPFIVSPGEPMSANIVLRKSSAMLHPLTFQHLCWPQAADLTPEGLPLYRGSAQLFLESLLQFDDGRVCLRSMISQLPKHWNWQTTFLLAFHSHFDQLLDVEKWWSVCYVECAGTGEVQPWSAADCRKKLQKSLDVPVKVHFNAGHMPVDARITLQEAIRQWPPADAAAAAQNAILGLNALEPRAAAEWRPLVRQYLKTLVDFLGACHEAGREPQMGKHSPSLLARAKADAIQQLDALDRQRQLFSL
jgi:hypothetical protein